MPGLAVGVDLKLHTGQHEIPQSKGLEIYEERVRRREPERVGKTAGEEGRKRRERKSVGEAERDERGIWKMCLCAPSTSFAAPAALNTCI